MIIYTIVVTYNAMRKQWIDRCISSLHASTVPTEILVVDNCSTDGTRSYIPETYPDVIWLPQEKNLGFGQANNLGINYALKHQADYVLLLNQDAAISSEAIEKMLAVSDGKSLLSPIHLNGDGSRLDFDFKYSLTRSDNSLFDDLLTGKVLQNSYITGEICAACWFIPVQLLLTIGGFNPLFYHYSEDNNYYYRTVYHHIKTIVVPQAKMYHDRLMYGNEQAYNHKLVYRDLLLHATNINLGLTKRLFESVRTLLRCYVYMLPRRQYRCGTYIAAVWKLLLQARRIKASRKAEKKKGHTWLQL